MSNVALFSEADLPLLIVRKLDETIAIVRDVSVSPMILPFSLRTCDLRPLHDAVALQVARDEGLLAVSERTWPVRARLRLALRATGEGTHWLLQLGCAGAKGSTPPSKSFGGNEKGLCEASAWLSTALTPDAFVELCAASEPTRTEMEGAVSAGKSGQIDGSDGSHERVLLADSAEELAMAVEDVLRAFFSGADGCAVPTSVFWPELLTFPVNIRCGVDAIRRAEHGALLLPMRPLLRPEQKLKGWNASHSLQKVPLSRVLRTGQSWEKHLLSNVHEDAKKVRTITGAETHLVSGCYDYYHYRVDGFKDDGWGCAYRSLQTILSWFQYEGIMDKPMPDIRTIQRVLSVSDADKINRKDFVGSMDWIGSFEIMIVLQHYVPHIECTIKRIEKGSDLDTDLFIQQLLIHHFKQKRSSPVMIGGSSYAHTILGVDVNPSTLEAQYLIADPHYSSNETVKKIVLNKGYVGWKEASKFFEAKTWYNLCIPQVSLYDPR